MTSFFNLKINLHIKYTWATKSGRNITNYYNSKQAEQETLNIKKRKKQ